LSVDAVGITEPIDTKTNFSIQGRKFSPEISGPDTAIGGYLDR
jgi:hypothetical protein